ncbi:MAG: TlpA family protein disulfide reductase [Chitinophagaceae bacterium]|nr:TlpA family protein disulfide reductase [Chitinophagaceae bacterium]
MDKDFVGNPALTDFAGSDSFLLNNLFINKDLLVIDFWGSWCVPCISSIPDFKKLYETYSVNRIGFLGILYDDLQNNKKIESVINKNEIKWRQAFINRIDSNTLIDEWRIFSFPTYLVINKQHKVVFRGIGSTGFLKLKEFLEISIRE